MVAVGSLGVWGSRQFTLGIQLALTPEGGLLQAVLVEDLPGIVNHSSDQARPTTLVGSTESSATITIEELVEPKVVLPVLIKIETVVAAVDATSAIVGAGKQMLETMLDLLCNLAQVHVFTAPGRTFHLELVSVEEEESLQRLYQEEVDAEPDWASPVTVSTKKSTVRVSRDVSNLELLPVDLHGEGVFFVIFRQ